MRGLPVEADRPSLGPQRAGHHSERKCARLEHRPLFDVQFDVAARVLEAATG